MARTKRKVNPLQHTPAPSAPDRRIYKAGCYVRLSVEDSGKPGADTIAMQEELLRDYIQSQPDMQLCGAYCDNGRTGTNFDRPGFERLMADIRAGKIDCIVVKDLSRFGRNYMETGNYLEKIFPFLDVRFIAINDNFDTLTAERSNDGYIIPLKNIINDVYSKDIARKSASALATKQQRGEFIGTWAAYGYRKCAEDPHQIEPDEETAPVVQNIFQWRLEGMSALQIARRLNEEGVPSPGRYHYLKGDAKSERYAGSEWHQQVLTKILTNEVYLGHMVQGRKHSGFSEGQKQKLRPKSEWVIVRDTHRPIIDEETFNAVQKMAAERNHTYHGRLGCYDNLGTTPNILRGLVFCADCKRPLVRYKSVTNRGRNRYYVFICQTHSDDLNACPKKYIHETELKEVLWVTLKKQLELAADLEKKAQQYVRSQNAMVKKQAFAQEMATAQKALERAQTLYDSLYQNYVDRLMTELEYVEMKHRYRAEVEQAKARIKDIEQRRQSDSKRVEKNTWLMAFTQFKDTTELTDELAHTLIERVEVDANNNVSVLLRYQDEYQALLHALAANGEAVPA